jgi:hemerythrin superfamily protein
MGNPGSRDAIQVLEADHRWVEALFQKGESSVAEIVRELSIHAAIEEQVLYPALRQLPRGEALVERSLGEHQRVKELLTQLEKGGDEHQSLLHELRLAVEEHVREEESEVFPLLRARTSENELREMGTALTNAKKMAPTHPHPHAPNRPPANVMGGAAAAVVDKARDAVRRR